MVDLHRFGRRECRFRKYLRCPGAAGKPSAHFDTLEFAAARLGLYPDDRSDAKGCEFEGVEMGIFGESVRVFIGAERGNFVGVYELANERSRPKLLQILATGDRPEGLLAIPQRRLFVTANEGDGTISVFLFDDSRFDDDDDDRFDSLDD